MLRNPSDSSTGLAIIDDGEFLQCHNSAGLPRVPIRVFVHTIQRFLELCAGRRGCHGNLRNIACCRPSPFFGHIAKKRFDINGWFTAGLDIRKIFSAQLPGCESLREGLCHGLNLLVLRELTLWHVFKTNVNNHPPCRVRREKGGGVSDALPSDAQTVESFERPLESFDIALSFRLSAQCQSDTVIGLWRPRAQSGSDLLRGRNFHRRDSVSYRTLTFHARHEWRPWQRGRREHRAFPSALRNSRQAMPPPPDDHKSLSGAAQFGEAGLCFFHTIRICHGVRVVGNRRSSNSIETVVGALNNAFPACDPWQELPAGFSSACSASAKRARGISLLRLADVSAIRG